MSQNRQPRRATPRGGANERARELTGIHHRGGEPGDPRRAANGADLGLQSDNDRRTNRNTTMSASTGRGFAMGVKPALPGVCLATLLLFLGAGPAVAQTTTSTVTTTPPAASAPAPVTQLAAPGDTPAAAPLAGA